jgi:hypothetical protein
VGAEGGKVEGRVAQVVGDYLTESADQRKSQSPHKTVNLSFIITNIKNKLTDLCGD